MCRFDDVEILRIDAQNPLRPRLLSCFVLDPKSFVIPLTSRWATEAVLFETSKAVLLPLILPLTSTSTHSRGIEYLPSGFLQHLLIRMNVC